MQRWMTKSMAVIVILSLSLGLALGCAQATPTSTPKPTAPPKAAAPKATAQPTTAAAKPTAQPKAEAAKPTAQPKSDAAAEFFRGKTIRWIVSSGAGSSTDLIGRVIAPHLAKEIGATVKVENMGTDEGINYVYTEGKRDGLTFLAKASNAVIANEILKAPGVQYEADKFSYLADVHPSAAILQISPKLPVKTLDDLRKAKGLKAGATSAKGYLAIAGAVTIELLGLDGKFITGYKSSKEIALALGQGEVDMMVISDSSAKNDEDAGLLVNFQVMGNKRSPVLPNTPTIFESGVKIPKELEAAHGFISSIGQIVALPPEVPQERVEYLRAAFQKLNDNKDLQADMRKLTDRWAPFDSGKEVQQTVAAVKANKGLADQLDAIFTKYKMTQ